ncbi:hypothetical protein NESM_000435100 [Novymonas esmeraldas]|uniref:Uncharacterized protein n=1 Tax=Novymonas esmeraldas TaxID=1808958 RepID=A0AAW0EPK1_9TRYP
MSATSPHTRHAQRDSTSRHPISSDADAGVPGAEPDCLQRAAGDENPMEGTGTSQQAAPIPAVDVSGDASSPLYPPGIIQRNHRQDTVHVSFPAAHSGSSNDAPEKQAADPADLASGALLIHPKKIDNLRRFRMLFVGLLLSISSSTQVMHSIFGVLGLQQVYLFTVREMVIVYASGLSFGLFALPFGVLYDWFGPRVSVALGSAIASLGHLLLALTFGGYIKHTVTNCAIFYALVCWGCFAIDVTIVPAVLTHMPRDRGVPTGLLLTFSSFGGSLFACLFRGFFQGNFEHLMWFMFAVTMAAGLGCVWYIEDAPYVVNRWRQRRITPRQQLRAYLVRNRYMSQLVPKRRYTFMTIILIVLNLYLMIQGVCTGFLAAEMTPGKLRGIAIGAIVLFFLILILVIPLNSIDGLSEQDKQVIAAAKAKEDALRALQEDRRQAEQAGRSGGNEEAARIAHEDAGSHRSASTGTGRHRSTGESSRNSSSGRRAERSGDDASDGDTGDRVRRMNSTPGDGAGDTVPTPEAAPRRDGGVLSGALGLPLYEQAAPGPTLVMVDIEGGADEAPPSSHQKHHHHHHHTGNMADGDDGDEGGATMSRQHTFQCVPLTPMNRQPSSSLPAAPLSGIGARAHSSVTVVMDSRGEVMMEGTQRGPHNPLSSATGGNGTAGAAAKAGVVNDNNPHIETINLCGEVYVVPVYKTTFLESLTRLDLWLIFYTTLCTWGIGLSLTGSYNIQVMLKARYGGMEYKHYILFASICGMATAIGRVFLGIYERILQSVRERTGVELVPTLLYPIASLGLFLGMVLWIAFPGTPALILPYIIGSYFYGMSTSITFYVLGTIFDRDIGMHYGFCYTGGAIGFVLCYWCAWYLTYEREASPLTLGYCIGERRCMNRAVGIYVALAFSSILSAGAVHLRYVKLVRGRLAQRRVIVSHVKRALLSCCCCCCSHEKDDDDGAAQRAPTSEIV